MELSGIPVIIQATAGETYPNHAWQQPICSHNTVLAYLAERLRQNWPGEIWLAHGVESGHDALEREAIKCGVRYVRSDSLDPVRILHDAAERCGCSCFIRVWISHPLIDMEAMGSLVKEHLARGVEYSYNGHEYGVLWGTDCEVINTGSLDRLLALNPGRVQREGATLFMRQNPDLFSQYRMNLDYRRADCKLVLETDWDLALIQEIARHVQCPTQRSINAFLASHPDLARSNLASPAQEVGLEKLFLNAGKVASLLAPENLFDPTYPISVELTLTNQCNLECEYCSDKGLRQRQGMEESLGTEALFRLFDDLRAGGTRGIVIEGGGEPTSHPHFEDIIDYLSSIGLAAGLITNGTSPLAPETLSRLEWIRVSLDASTRQEFLELKKMDCFESVMENIGAYARHCPTVGVGYVITSRNISQLETVIMMLRGSGVSYVQCRPVVDCPEMEPRGVDLGGLQVYQTEKFAVITDGMQDNAGRGNDGLPCRAHSITTIISAEGSVFLCGRLNIYDWFKPIGNINRQGFREIWHGAERRAQAKMVANAGFCQQFCPQCRVSKFNRLLRRLDSMSTPHFI